MKRISLTVRSLIFLIIIMGILPDAVYGQVSTLRNWTNQYHGTFLTSQNIEYSIPAGSNSNRILVVAIAASRSPVGVVNVSLSYGGQSLTLANGDMSVTNVKQHTALYYLNEAGLEAATDQILAVTVSDGTNAKGITDVWAAVFDYVDQTDPITDSETYNGGTIPTKNFSLSTPLTINAYNQAIEVITTHNNLINQPTTITYAPEWTMILEQTGTYSYSFGSYSVKNGIANRLIPNSDITDASPTSLDKNSLVSITALSLNYEAPPPPTIQASNITFTDVTSSSFTINWDPGDGTNRLVLLKAAGPVDSDPANGTTYTASSLFGEGTEIGSGNFVVYNGMVNSVTVYNLDASTVYHVAVYEFSGPPGLEFYLTPPARGSQLTGPETALTDDYRTIASGNWNDAAIWQTYDGSAWVAAGTSPTSASGVIRIRNGHTVTVSESVTVDQVVISSTGQVTITEGVTWTINDGTDVVDCDILGTIYNSGTIVTTGVLIFNSGSVYQHARDGGSIPNAAWDANSDCRITDITNTAPSGFGQSFGNLIWNCPSQGPSLIVPMNSNITVKGSFTLLSTGSGRLTLSDNSISVTMIVMGNYNQTGGIFDLNNGLPSTATNYLNVAGNFHFTNGTITESSSSGRGSIHFNGDDIMQIFTGGGTFSKTVDFIVESGAYLQLGTGSSPSIISGSEGAFTLSAGATLGITDRYGITKTTTGTLAGNIRVTGTRSFSVEANYIYNGSVNQYTGYITDVGLPETVNSLVFNNTGGVVTFPAVCNITNNFSITSGSKANLGNSLIHTAGFLLLGGVAQGEGSYGGNTSGADNIITEYFSEATGIVNVSPPAGTWLGNTSDWNQDFNWIGGIPASGTNAIINSYAPNQPVISVTTTASCNTATINTGASLTIDGTAQFTNANNNGTLTINPGGKATITALTNSGTLNLESDASGMFSLMLETYSGTTGTVNTSLYLTGGVAAPDEERWHYFAVPSQQDKSVLTDINPFNLMNYIESSAVNDIWEGWQWHDGYDGTTGFDQLMVTEGYNFWNEEDVNVTFTGNSLLTSMPVKNLSFSVYGWNFIGNSLTCGLDWDDVIISGDVDPTVNFLKDYQEYYYIQGGPGVPAGTTGEIPPLQGFFVQANASGGSLDFSGAKIHSNTSYYKGEKGNSEGSKGYFPIIRLGLDNEKFSDETAIWFNEEATMDNDRKFDAAKMISEDSRAQICSIIQGKEYAINGIPSPSTSVSIPVAIRVPEEGTWSIKKISIENLENYSIYLRDLRENFTVDLNSIPQYSFSSSAGTVKDRFLLIIKNLSSGENEISASDEPFNIYSSFGFINIELLTDTWDGLKGSVKVTDLMGRTLIDSGDTEFSRSSIIRLPVKENKGILIVEISSGQSRHTARVVVR